MVQVTSQWRNQGPVSSKHTVSGLLKVVHVLAILQSPIHSDLHVCQAAAATASKANEIGYSTGS